MAAIVNRQQGAWQYLTSVSVTSQLPTGDSLDMRTYTRGVIYASSTHGVPVLTYWSAPSSSGTYRLLKTSTGGAVTTTIIANSAISMPAAVANAQFIRLTSTTTGAPKALPAVLLKK